LDAARKENIYIVEENGRVQSAGYYDEITWSIGSTVMKAVRPREMSGEASVPGQDGFDNFIRGYRGCFKMAKENGCALSVVHGSMYDHAFCGFVPSFYYAVTTLPCEIANKISTDATIREPRTKSEEKAGDATFWRDPYATKLTAFLGGGKMHVVERNGSIEGYLRINPDIYEPAKKYAMPFGHVSFITVKSRGAALAVIKLAGELTEKAGDPEVCILESHETLITQTILNLGGKYLLRPSCPLQGLDAEMVCIIDLPKLTHDLKDEFQSRLTSSPGHNVEGSFSIQMDGDIIGFIIQSGHLNITTEKQKSHRILPRWLTTRLYTGYYSGEDVLRMGPIPFDRSDGKTPDNPKLDMKEFKLPKNLAPIFAALFPKLWPCSMPDPDVWPWVIGKPHPNYQNEVNKTDEMKRTIDALRFPWIGH
jgi:hypothetical protein